MATHLAAVLTGKGNRFEIQERATPKPGPGELLIAVKSIALNPADHIMRDQGIFIAQYPTVIGFDISGLVLEVGEDVPQSSLPGDSGLSFQPGVTRAAAYSSSVWKGTDPDYGVFQERCLVPWQHAAPLPVDGISWNHAATLPVSSEVPQSAWDSLEIPRLGSSSLVQPPNTTDGVNTTQKKNEVLLIWGASSSVGSMGVQSARLLKESTDSIFSAVYATAGSMNLDYVRSLGADRVFDYKDPLVVESIVKAAKNDGLVIRNCFLAMGDIIPCQVVLKAFLEDLPNKEKSSVAKIASSPPVPPNTKIEDSVEVIFIQPSQDESIRLGQYEYWMGTWLRENLAKGTIKPSPEPRVVGKGLEAINTGLDILKQGVSCTKLVVEIAE